jgi:hypothetical protein
MARAFARYIVQRERIALPIEHPSDDCTLAVSLSQGFSIVDIADTKW